MKFISCTQLRMPSSVTSLLLQYTELFSMSTTDEVALNSSGIVCLLHPGKAGGVEFAGCVRCSLKLLETLSEEDTQRYSQYIHVQ